ncbi:MAG TPA: hypothetical protein VH678_21350 [Xanthobacteraceae bacterium]
MKLIPVAVLALAVVASLVVYRAQAKPPVPLEAQACVGIDCWPQGFPTKHRSAHRPSLPPIW